ncbi:hypothetical protein BN8_01624 [Fibrisoma limi BUZ 3]|uniref:Uncharacterized protein n=1 Tax=Fibrisoma limi BUZ 3 TaxID=1185876 RepID=I2GFD6_9BACT|nr:hypothetical protein [Fibrisoma limi]CCH52611.1 hypothetical protein BN8_01624 [Fibrisoma limi BUZ 3]
MLSPISVWTHRLYFQKIGAMVRLRVVWILYKQIGVYSVATSLALWLLAGMPTLRSGNFSEALVFLLWTRTLSQLLIWYLFRTTNRKGFFFYHHFGWSERQLALLSYLIDLVCFGLWICLMSVLL